jgi:H+-translocating NAD(P) transhydrogenase subunit alpha
MDLILNFLVENKAMIYMLVLSIFVGIEIISKVPAVLHTPLMSGANAIHGVVVVGAIIVMGEAKSDDTVSLLLGFIAVILGTLNVVGGFVVTDRMLEMFKKKVPAKKA